MTVEELNNYMVELANDMDEIIDESVKNSLDIVEALVRAETPVQTGKLISHWKKTDKEIYNDCEYAKFVIPDVFEEINPSSEEILTKELEKSIEKRIKK